MIGFHLSKMSPDIHARRASNLPVLAALSLSVAGFVSTGTAEAQTVSLPADEAPHTDSNGEVWYFTGHLHGVDPAGKSHSYGYNLTLYQAHPSALLPAIYVAILAMTDHTGRTFHTESKTITAPVPAQQDGFSLGVGDWHMQGSSGFYSVNGAFSDDSYAIALNMETTIPPVLHGISGEIPYGPFGTSAYYSYTALSTMGTIIDHGVPIHVTGSSWQDRQWGNYKLAKQGWTWLCIQMAGNTQYMLYFIQDGTGAYVQTVATQVKNGVATALPTDLVSQTPLGFWKSPRTGYSYPTQWLVKVPGGSFTVTPVLPGQEIVGEVGHRSYYEADSTVTGSIDGAAVSGAAFGEVFPYQTPVILLP